MLALAVWTVPTTRAPHAATLGTHPAPPPSDDGLQPFRAVVLAPDPQPAAFAFDRAKGKIETAGELAGEAAGDVLALKSSNGTLNTALGAGTVALAPLAAARAALGAGKRLSHEQLAECETNLVRALTEVAVQQRFHRHLLAAAQARRWNALIAGKSLLAAGTVAQAAGSVLHARVEELRLQRTGASDTSFALLIRARTRLVRVADGTVLYEEPAEFRSNTGLFLDWTRHQAVQGVADTGYQKLADHFIEAILATRDGLCLTSPVPAPASGAAQLASAQPVAANVNYAAQAPATSAPANNPDALTGTLRIYSTAPDSRLDLAMPVRPVEPDDEVQADVEHALDGLDNHHNPVVSAAACVAALPMSMWRHSEAWARKVAPGKTRAAMSTLSAAVDRVQPHEDLALSVAREWARRLPQPVQLVKEPVPASGGNATPIMLCLSGGLQRHTAAAPKPPHTTALPPADAVLEIRMSRAELAGDTASSKKLALRVVAHATLRRAADAQSLGCCSLSYRSQAHSLTRWSAHDARLFQDECKRCYGVLSRTVVSRLAGQCLAPQTPQGPATLAQR
jgi:hypothetical protein